MSPTGLRSWRMKYRFSSKEKVLTFGPYPEVKLGAAREKRDEARAALRAGRDPGMEKKIAAAAGAADAENTFATVATAWHKLHKSKWSPTHANDVIDSLKRDVFPKLGALPINIITLAWCSRHCARSKSVRPLRLLAVSASACPASSFSRSRQALGSQIRPPSSEAQ